MKALKTTTRLRGRNRRSLLPQSTALSFPANSFQQRTVHFSSTTSRCFSNNPLEDTYNSNGRNTFSTRTFNRRVESETEWKQFASDVSNQNIFPVGELSVEEFLGLEDTLNWGLQNLPVSRESIEESLTIYRRLLQEFETNSSIAHEENYGMTHWFEGNYPRSVKLLDTLLTTWYKWWIRSSQEQDLDLGPEAMLDLIENLRAGNPPLPVTDKSFSIIIAAANKRPPNKEPKNAAIFADRLLERLLKESIENVRVRPSNVTLNAVLNAWSKSGLAQATEKIDELFHRMETLYDNGMVDRPPDEVAHLAAMQAWSKSGKKIAPFKVEDILKSMKNSTTRYVSPTTQAYRIAIHAWVNSDRKDAGKRAHALFVELMDLYMAGDERMELDADFFSILISKLARERQSEMAEEVFQLLKQLSQRDSRFEPTPRALLGMIIAYSKSKNTGSIVKAESLLLNLQEKAEALDDMNSLPKRGYYRDVIFGLAKSGLPDGIDRAETLLFKMIDYHLSGVPGMLPDKPLFDALILAWSRQKRLDAAQKAEALLNTMQQLSGKFRIKAIKADQGSYLNVMTAWSRSEDLRAPERCEQLFFDMLQQFNDGDRAMKPSMSHYTTLISCWARSEDSDGPNRAQTVFDAAMDLYKESGKDRAFQPDRNLYYSLMRAWSKAGEANVVESLFLEMFDMYSNEGHVHLKPDTFSFNIMLEAWSRSGHPEAHEKAKLLFESMLDFTRDGTIHVPPDGYTYKFIIDVMSKSQAHDSADRAEKYLEMFKATLTKTDMRAQHKAFSCYTSTIAAWCWTNSTDAKENANDLIEELVDLAKTRSISLPSQSEYFNFLSVVAQCDIPLKSDIARSLLNRPTNELRVTPNLLEEL